MPNKLGIRRENKNKWERRVPLTPEHLHFLSSQLKTLVAVQPSEYRIFDSSQYVQVGARVGEDLSDCDIIMGVKEVPQALLQPNKVYLNFSHTIKGQAYNMGKLQRLLDLGCTLIDYECIVDSRGRRLVFFGHFAGLAGMIESLYAMGKRMQALAIDSPLNAMRQAFEYGGLTEAKAHVGAIGDEIRKNGLPESMRPFVVGFAGYGNVSQGAQEIYDLLPVEQVRPQDIATLPTGDGKVVYKVVFYEKDLVQPTTGAGEFDPQEYFQEPEKFQSIFDRYLPHLNILLNGIYWDDRYPRLVTKKFVRDHAKEFRILVIGDVSCDINGSIELTGKITEPDASFYVYQPATGAISDKPATPGIGIMAIDNLPAEFAAEASQAFGDALLPFMPPLINADFSASFEDCSLPPEIRKAVIVYNGRLTPKYSYLKEYLSKSKE